MAEARQQKAHIAKGEHMAIRQNSQKLVSPTTASYTSTGSKDIRMLKLSTIITTLWGSKTMHKEFCFEMRLAGSFWNNSVKMINFF